MSHRRLTPRGPRAQFVIVTLSSSRLGAMATAIAFDAWVEFVHEQLGPKLVGRELEVIVSCHGFGEGRDDTIQGARDKGAIVQALEELWRTWAAARRCAS